MIHYTFRKTCWNYCRHRISVQSIYLFITPQLTYSYYSWKENHGRQKEPFMSQHQARRRSSLWEVLGLLVCFCPDSLSKKVTRYDLSIYTAVVCILVYMAGESFQRVNGPYDFRRWLCLLEGKRPLLNNCLVNRTPTMLNFLPRYANCYIITLD